ncbi:MAG: hypothetical protein ACRCZI_10845 [Cetobacterium sp.]
MNKVIEITKVGFSVNIERDYSDNQKINSYIPTEKNVKLLAKLAKSVLNKKNGSYILSGAYGSGKSYFLSVLLNLLSVKNEKEIDIFLNRADEKFPIKEICSKFNGEKYLVVFAKDRFQSYEKAILHGILEAIKRENLDVSLNLESKIILNKIDFWTENHSKIISKFEDRLNNKSIDLEVFKEKLKNNSSNSIELFKSIYKEIFYGEEFINYESNFQISDLMKDFEDKILDLTSYKGVIYVFDEFGRYLETNINEIDVKEIQDMAEYCNSESSSYLFLITHKDIFQYTNKLNREDNIFEWEKVSGRFHKEQMTYDKVTSLSILSQVVYKKESFNEFYDENFDKFSLYKQNLVEANLLIEDSDKTIKSFYPLNYLSAYILPELSQKIAQNERTMFAFLSSGDVRGLENVLKDDFIVGLDRIYDYFEENFKFLNHESLEYKSFFNTRKALNLVKLPEQIKFLKTLGVLQIYNRAVDVPPTKEILKLSLNIQESDLDKILADLENLNIISFKRNKKYYKIVEDSDVNIQKEIKDYLINKLHNLNYTESLNKNLNLDIYYPVKYNFEKDITRYLQQIYLDCSSTSCLDKLNKFADGTIVYLVNISKVLNFNEIKNILKLKDIILVSNKNNDNLKINGILREIEAIEHLVLLEANYKSKAILEEYSLYKDELIQILKEELNKYFSSENIEINCFGEANTSKNLLQVTYEYLVQKFKNYIPINYELMNKEKISTPMKKVRTTLFEMLIDGDQLLLDDKFYLETGAINSVARTVLNRLVSLNNKNIHFKDEWIKLEEEILSLVQKSEYTLESLYNDYTSSIKGYGLRSGIFTMFLGILLIKNKNSVLVIDSKNKKKEILKSDLIERIEKNPENYYLTYLEKSEDKEIYLNKLVDILGIYYVDNLDVESGILEGLKNYFYSLSRLINRVSLEKCKFLSKVFKSLFQDKDPYKFLFEELLQRAKTKSYDDVIEILSKEIIYLEDEKLKIEDELKLIINETLGDLRDLKNNLESWQAKDDILDNGIKTWLKKYKYRGDRSFILDITSKIKGFNYENWSSLDDITDFDKKLKEFLTVKENKVALESSNSVQIISSGDRVVIEIMQEHTAIGKMLKTKLEATIKAMGMALKEEEKKSILLEILKEM